MDALKNAASGLLNKPATGGAAGTTGTTHNAAAAGGKPSMVDQGIDAAQNAGYLPKTGTQQGNMVDQGQKAYAQYGNKGSAPGGTGI